MASWQWPFIVALFIISLWFWALILRRAACERDARAPLLVLAALEKEQKVVRFQFVTSMLQVLCAHLAIPFATLAPDSSSPMWASMALVWLSGAAFWAVQLLTPDQVTDRGLLLRSGLIDWKRIRLYHWEKEDTLALLLRPRTLRPSVQRLPVTPADREALEPILARYIGHSVPTRDEGAGHAPRQ